jgi:hypothetical protein
VLATKKMRAIGRRHAVPAIRAVEIADKLQAGLVPQFVGRGRTEAVTERFNQLGPRMPIARGDVVATDYCHQRQVQAIKADVTDLRPDRRGADSQQVTIEPDQPFAARILGEVNIEPTERAAQGCKRCRLDAGLLVGAERNRTEDPVVVEYHSDIKRRPCRAGGAGEDHQSQRRS